MKSLTKHDLIKFEGQRVVVMINYKNKQLKVNEVTYSSIITSTGREYKFDSINEIHLMHPYCIGCRYNPQLNKPYYRAYGKLTREDIKNKQKTLYGSMSIEKYDSEAEYLSAIDNIKSKGYHIW